MYEVQIYLKYNVIVESFYNIFSFQYYRELDMLIIFVLNNVIIGNINKILILGFLFYYLEMEFRRNDYVRWYLQFYY